VANCYIRLLYFTYLTHQIRDEYTRRNVELMDENERLSTENRRLHDELQAGTCGKLEELTTNIEDLDRNLVVVKGRRDALKTKFEYVYTK